MSGERPIPPPSSKLSALVAEEREAVDVVPDARADAILSAVEGVVALGPPPGPTAGAAGGVTSAAAAKGISMAKAIALAVGTLAVGAAGGVTVDRLVLSSRTAASVPVVADAGAAPALAPSETREVPSAERPAAPSEHPSAVPAPSRSAPPPPSAPSPQPSAPDLVPEQTIIDAARAALASGRYDVAIEALDRHQRAFPRGQFSEERDALRILALARSGRMGEAKARAAQFRRAYPKSALLPKIDRATGAPD